MAAYMRKAFYYNFFPTKAEETEAISNSTMHYQMGRTLVEIRDDVPTLIDPTNPWRIFKRVTPGEISTGKLIFSEADTLEHVFRYWPMEQCNQVLMGNKVRVVVYDVTIEEAPSVHGPADDTAFEKGLAGCFVLRLNMGMVRNWALLPGAKISLYWNDVINAFYLKVFY